MFRAHFVACAVLCLCLNGNAAASEIDYTCRVGHVYHLQALGTLTTAPESELEKNMRKNPFTISRETGAVAGKSSTLDTSSAKSTLVIHRGSAESSFEAVADFGVFKSGTHPYQVIKVEEYQRGSEKPFVAMGDLEIITGICK